MISMLKHFETFSPLLKKLFLLHCDPLFILFICEIILNVLEGNLQIQSKIKFVQYEEVITQLIDDRAKSKVSIKSKREILASDKGLKLQALLYKPVLDHFNHLH